MSIKEQFDTYGHTFQSNPYGKTGIFTIEPPNLQAILATDSKSFGLEPLRLFFFEPFIGRGIVTTDGPFWKHSRALIRPTFARAQVADLSAMKIHVDRLIDLIPKDGSTVDLQPLFARLTLDFSTEFLFGESVRSLCADSTLNAKDFLAAYNYGQSGVGQRMQLPKWNILTRDKKFWASCKIARDFVDEYVEKALSHVASHPDEKPNRHILAHELARETSDRIDIRNQLLNIFLPAHDASAVSMTNLLFHLARYPNVWAKLRHEALTLAPVTEELSFERLKSLKYLQHVLNETLRLNPVTGTVGRIALRDAILPCGGGPGGSAPVFVKKGDVVTISLYALHRRKDLFGDDADVFRPERWDGLRPPHWGYLPFGGGPRVCPAQQLALTEMAYTLVRLLREFRAVENRDPVWEYVEVWKMTTESGNGAKVSMVPA
jgi:cytochrome P450